MKIKKNITLDQNKEFFLKNFQSKNYLERVFFRYLNQIIKRVTSQKNFFLHTILIFIVTISLIIILSTFYICDPILVWKVDDYEKPSIVYGYNNKGEIVPFAEFYSQNRKIITLSEDDFNHLNVVKTFIAAEDIRFRDHFGIDIPGIVRASIINLMAGKIKEGASTLTQQTARLRFLNRQRTITRKLREVSLSLFLELRYPKYKILEIYFNEVPLGHGTIGIDAAAKFYFNKSYNNLTIGESSVLSSLTTSPNNYSPLKDPIRSINKMKVTFIRLVENGEISIQEAEKEYHNIINNYILTLNRYPDESSFTNRMDKFPYVTAYLFNILPKNIKENLTTGGYEIYTTINVDKQRIAEESLQNWLKQLNKQKAIYQKDFTNYEIFDERFNHVYPILKIMFGINDFKFKQTKEERDFKVKLKEIQEPYLFLNFLVGERNIINAFEHNIKKTFDNPTIKPDSIEGALVSINPINGKIEALVGGSRFIPANQLLRFLSRRQPGSSLKPFIYGAGIDHFARNPHDTLRGITAATILEDNPITFIDKDLSEYEPENYGGNYLGQIRVREALILSRNSATVHAYAKIGSDIINKYLEQIFDLPENTLPREATVALGSYEITPLQLAKAYTVFPRQGSTIEPYLIEKITKKIKNEEVVIYEKKEPKVKNIFLPETTFILNDILKDVLIRGTGKAAYIPNVPVFGKTGTSNRYTNAWFAGYTPDNVTVIYIGYDKNKSLGAGGTGGSLAAPVWRTYMYNVLKDLKFPKYKEEEVPPNIIKKSICKLTGQLPYENQCDVTWEYFIIGTEPKETCEIHSKKQEPHKNLKIDLDLNIKLD